MITIYSKEKCQQCDSAKLLCQMKGVDYEVKMFDVDFSRDELLKIAPNTRSFPVVFKGGALVGGLHQLQQILNGDSL